MARPTTPMRTGAARTKSAPPSGQARLIDGACQEVFDSEQCAPAREVVGVEFTALDFENAQEIAPLLFGDLAAEPEPAQLLEHDVLRAGYLERDVRIGG